MSNLKIFTGNANPELARSVARHLDAAIGNVDVGTFSDGEVSVEIRENVRGSDCFVVQPTSQPANNHIMELLIMVDALRRSSARKRPLPKVESSRSIGTTHGDGRWPTPPIASPIAIGISSDPHITPP